MEWLKKWWQADEGPTTEVDEAIARFQDLRDSGDQPTRELEDATSATRAACGDTCPEPEHAALVDD